MGSTQMNLGLYSIVNVHYENVELSIYIDRE